MYNYEGYRTFSLLTIEDAKKILILEAIVEKVLTTNIFLIIAGYDKEERKKNGFNNIIKEMEEKNINFDDFNDIALFLINKIAAIGDLNE